MSNLEKDYIIDDGNGKIFTMPREGFENSKRNHNFQLWRQVGLAQPENIHWVWYVDEEERNKAIRDRKPFKDSFNADSYFRITKRLDPFFVEGHLGHPNYSFDFFAEILSGYTYFDDYLTRKKIYFTFDQISLYQVAEIFKTENPIRLILKRIDNLPVFKSNTAFMIMPFGDETLNTFYEENIQKFLKNTFDINVYRSDNFSDNDVIIDTILRLIEDSEFIISELTEKNKNVFYELGYAVAKGKEIIPIQNESVPIFFDRAHYRTLLYNLEDTEKFKINLSEIIKTIRGRL